MYSILYLLYISSVIASLTYSLGTLFYGSPIPITSFKRFGHKMILDAIYADIWVNLFFFIINIINQIQSSLGYSWSIFYLDIGMLNLQLIYTINAFKLWYVSLSALVSYIRFPTYLINVLGPLLQYISFLTDILFSLAIYLEFGIFIEGSYMTLIAIGVLLMSLPFRMGKGIGGYLIGFAIVFYIGFPYLPVLISGASPSVYNLVVHNLQLSLAEISLNFPILVYSFVILPIVYIGILMGFSFILGSFISGYLSRLPISIDI